MTYYTPAERKHIREVVRLYDRNYLARHLAMIEPGSTPREQALAIRLIGRGPTGHLAIVEWLAGMHRTDRTDTTIAGALIAERRALRGSLRMLRDWSNEITEAA